MWVVAIILVSALAGPEVHVVRDDVYKDEAACKAAIAHNVPAKLEERPKQEFEQGFRRYVCVRVGDTDTLMKAK